ncbi:cupin domain-containing protein [Thermodesulfobacteriota bacterium]
MADQYIDEIPERKEFLKKHEITGVRAVKNLKEHPVTPRKIRANAGAYFHLKDFHVLNAHITELPPAKIGKKHRHSNEAMIYILAGKGYSILKKDGQPEERVDWAEGDLMGIPAYFWHQHYNTDPEKPARYFAVKNVPLMEKMGLFIVEQAKD